MREIIYFPKALRHLQDPSGVQRLRVQDPRAVLRDGLHQAEGDRRLQAEGRHELRRGEGQVQWLSGFSR